MEKQKPSQKDIAEQHYKGPGMLATGLGEGVLHTKVLATTGLILGGIAAYIFHEPLEGRIASAKHWIETASQSENGWKKAAGIIIKFPFDIGNHLASMITNLGPIKNGIAKLNQQQRVEVAIDGAIVTSTAASILAGFTGATSGAVSAIAGKRQFDTAKQEITHLRQQNTELQARLDKTQAELDDIKTVELAQKGTLRVSNDDPPKMQGESYAADGAMPSTIISEIESQNRQHQKLSGALSAESRDASAESGFTLH
jgi:hypothetical protein